MHALPRRGIERSLITFVIGAFSSLLLLVLSTHACFMQLGRYELEASHIRGVYVRVPDMGLHDLEALQEISDVVAGHESQGVFIGWLGYVLRAAVMPESVQKRR